MSAIFKFSGKYSRQSGRTDDADGNGTDSPRAGKEAAVQGNADYPHEGGWRRYA